MGPWGSVERGVGKCIGVLGVRGVMGKGVKKCVGVWGSVGRGGGKYVGV